MKLYLVRHGQSEANKAQIISGWLDTPLSEEGLKEAENTVTQLPQGIDIFYCSDLLRCRQTAEILNRDLRFPVTYDARLRERNFGSLSGKPWDNDTQGKFNYDYRPFGGENTQDVRARVEDFLRELRLEHHGKSVLIVTSAGIVRMIHNIAFGKAPELIHNASIHEFEFPDN